MKKEIQKEIQSAGVEIIQGIDELGEEVYIEELDHFLKGIEFIKLGQAINHQHWESAIMCTKRMSQIVNRLHISCLQQLLSRMNQAVINKKRNEAKQILAIIIQKRVALLKALKKKE